MNVVRETVLKYPDDGVREVCTVPEAAFVRQRDILPWQKLHNARVTVIGAGAVGSFTALSLVKMGVGTIEVFDHDTVSVENLGPQWFRVCDLGRNKVDALADQLSPFGGTVVACAERYIAQPVTGIVVCTVNSVDARVAIWSAMKKSRRVELFLDAQMGAEVGKVFAVRPADPEDCRAYRTRPPRPCVNPARRVRRSTARRAWRRSWPRRWATTWPGGATDARWSSTSGRGS